MRTVREAVTIGLMLATASVWGTGVSPSAAGSPSVRANGPAVAVLPLVDFSGVPDATDSVFSSLVKALSGHGVNLIPPETLRPVMRKHRIRAVGMIDQTAAKVISEETGASYLLLGSTDFISDQSEPIGGMSLRLLRIPECRLVWATSAGASGGQYIGLLGLGAVSRVDSLTARLADEAADDVAALVGDGSQELKDAPAPTIAIVPFDDLDPDRPIGAVASAYLLSYLVERGMHVVEPGLVQALFLQFGRMPRGEIDYELIGALRDSLGVDLVLTGTVNGFTANVDDAGQAAADISLSARMIDARSGEIIGATNVSEEARAGQGLLYFRSGPVAARLMSRAAEEVTRRLGVLRQEGIVGGK